VLATEVAPAIVTLAGSGALGTLRTVPQVNSVASITATHERILALHGMRTPVLQSYVVFSIGVFLAAWPVLWFAFHRRFRYNGIWELLLMAVAAFPLATMLLPLLDPRSALLALLLVGTITLLLAIVAKWLGRSNSNAFLLIFAATSIVLVVDVILGSPLIHWSVLGYDTIGGARFYGIGNEYGGVLLTSTIMAGGLLLQQHPRAFHKATILFALVLTAVVTGAPWWGANNGDAAAAVLGFAFTVFFFLGGPINIRKLLLAGFLLIVAATLAIVLDLTLNPTAPSHLGLLAQQVAKDGIQPVFVIAGRKLAMNWKLLKYTIWTKVLIASLVVSLALLARPLPWIRQFIDRVGILVAAAKGALVTAMFLLLLNDSGVVAAATAMIPVTTILLFMATHSLASESDI
jgi:hypothetical protein